MQRFCLLYTSDAADDLLCVDLGGPRSIKKKKKNNINLAPKRDKTRHTTQRDSQRHRRQ